MNLDLCTTGCRLPGIGALGFVGTGLIIMKGRMLSVLARLITRAEIKN